VKREDRLDPVLPSAFLDALIDFPEDLLVPRRPFSKVHAGILTDLPLASSAGSQVAGPVFAMQSMVRGCARVMIHA
jgi:hypothetical protein